MKQRTLGNDVMGHVQVGAIGLGFMPITWPSAHDDSRVDATVRAALDAGVTLIDTADSYGSEGRNSTGENEQVLAGSLDRLGVRDQVMIATKGGSIRTEDGEWGLDGSAQHLRAALEDSLRRLGVDVIDLYQFHRPDPAVPYAESLGALADLQSAGKIRMLGISNADREQIQQARELLGDAFVGVQNQFAPDFRSSRDELDLCAALGVAFLPWSPLGGIGRSADLGGAGSAFVDVADELGVSPQRVCLAWMLALSPVVVPIPGASRPETITDSAGASDVELTEEQLNRLTAAD